MFGNLTGQHRRKITEAVITTLNAQDKRLEIKRSNIKEMKQGEDKGLFAKERIEKGEKIKEYKGEWIRSKRALHQKYPKENCRYVYPMRTGDLSTQQTQEEPHRQDG